jgi:hypothetical protein
MIEPKVVKKIPLSDRGASHYLIIALVALGTILLVMIQREAGVTALLPILAGLIGLGTRFGPIVFLITLGLALNTLPYFGSKTFWPGLIEIPELLLCSAVLAYAIAHYRFQCLVTHIFPPDPRRRRSNKAKRSPFLFLVSGDPVMKARRSTGLVSATEIMWLIISLPIFGGLAQVIWKHLPTEGSNPGLQPTIWHAVVIAWLVGLSGFVVAAILGYWRFRIMTPEEAALYLQDTVWEQSRREQRRISRWVAWARLRYRRKKGES